MQQQQKALLKSFGFDDHKWIKAENITVAQWVRVKCEFGCSDYGQGACPPNTPSVSECRQFFGEYANAILIRVSTSADKHNYPSGWSQKMTDKLLELEKQFFLNGYHKAFLLNQTCCVLCSSCPGSRMECKDKKRSRPSSEAFAVDVYKTVRDAGMEVNVISEPVSVINRYAILLVD